MKLIPDEDQDLKSKLVDRGLGVSLYDRMVG